MIKELRYSGYTANTSDYECADGDLDLSLGLVQENAHQEQLFEPQERIKLRNGEEVVFIHKTSSYTHYISITGNGSNVWWFNEPSEVTGQNATRIHSFRDGEQFVRATAIGNTLIIISNKAMYYCLWRETSEDYDYLGDKLPEVPLSFGLRGTMRRSTGLSLSFSGSYDLTNMGQTLDLSDSDKTSITQQALAVANKFIAEESINANKFLFPFFVRYALRLYDGSIVMHSAPILMTTYTSMPLRLLTSSTTVWYLSCIVHDLDYRALISEEEFNTLKNWKDIVSSVDIFISKPIYSYDQNGEVTRFVIENVIDNIDYSICKKDDETNYKRHKFFEWYEAKYGVSEVRLLELPTHSDEIFNNYITDNSTFYFLKSIPIEDLSILEREIIDIPEKHLENLLVQEVMTDDYDSHDRLIPNYTYIYNNKLHLADLEKEIFTGFSPKSIVAHVTENSRPRYIEIYYHLNIDGKKIVVKSTGSEFGDDIGDDADFVYLYYPSIYAYQVEIIETRNTMSGLEFRKATRKLKQHPFLNGAYYFYKLNMGVYPSSNEYTNNYPSEPVSESRVYSIESKIYSSEINNPFFFPLLGINTVGVGKIKALASATQALSQGQFGQFPLYAFTTEGTWALEISATGGFSKVHPISRDVILSQNSICQIDTGVLFATNRGIIALAGSETICISDDIDNKTTTNVNSLPKLDILNNDDNNKFPPESLTIEPFKNFLPGCRMIYDYVNSRIIVFNRGKRYSYVYSLESKKWGMNLSHLYSAIPSYPSALAIKVNPNDEWTLVDVSQPKEETPAKALLVTRPFKLDLPNDLKTIQTVIQRGVFKKNQIKQILYASNDLFNWRIVSSSSTSEIRGFSGTPYKYFRIALFCNFAKGDSLYGCTIEYEPRMMNRLR